MAINQQITPAPPAPQRSDPNTFSDKADNFVAWLETLGDVLNQWAEECNSTENNINTLHNETQQYKDQAQQAAANANTYKNQAQQAATESTNNLRDFKGRYYGAYDSAPDTDPYGNPIDEGDMYYNTTDKKIYVWNGTEWDTYMNISAYDSNNDGKVNSAEEADNAQLFAGHDMYYFATANHNHDDTYVKQSDYEDSDVLNKIKNVDGQGSELDADFVRGLPADFTCAKDENGYTKLPNGLIIQWGKVSCNVNSGSGSTDVGFPIQFNNNPYIIQCTAHATESSPPKVVTASYHSVGKSGFDIVVETSFSESITITCSWLAIGI